MPQAPLLYSCSPGQLRSAHCIATSQRSVALSSSLSYMVRNSFESVGAKHIPAAKHYTACFAHARCVLRAQQCDFGYHYFKALGR